MALSNRSNALLVRKFIGRKLSAYYAQPSHKVVGRSVELESATSTRATTNRNGRLLSSLLGEWHWKRVFQRIYEEREGHWLTPVELFQPHFSYVLGDFCAQYYEQTGETNSKGNDSVNDKSKSASNVLNENDSSSFCSKQPFEIVEIGGGRGTNADWILSYLQECKPHVYASLRSYTLVDSSPSLLQTQKNRFLDGPHADKVRFELKDLSDVAQGTVSLLSKSETPTVLIGMEVLDNLPHDKIRGMMRHKLQQAEVVVPAPNSENQRPREQFVPLTDPLLKMILQKVPGYYTQQQPEPEDSLLLPPLPQTDASWIPTVACGILHHAIQQRPKLGLVLADFDWLPPPDLDLSSATGVAETPAAGAPIVTDMDGRDHESYLTAPPHCDILFPTRFEGLASFARRCLPRSSSKPKAIATVRVEKQSAFLERVGPEHVTKTKSWLTGHTPLLHEFSNCSVLTIDRSGGTQR